MDKDKYIQTEKYSKKYVWNFIKIWKHLFETNRQIVKVFFVIYKRCVTIYASLLLKKIKHTWKALRISIWGSSLDLCEWIRFKNCEKSTVSLAGSESKKKNFVNIFKKRKE